MARLPRLSVGGCPHVLVQRGHGTQPVFTGAEDKALFRAVLTECARALGVSVHAYALLDQEVRLLLTPPEGTTLSRMMQGVGRRYGSAFNRRHARTGNLWEGRFRATVIEPERHLLNAMRWLEGFSAAQSDVVSSREHHVGDRHDAGITDHPHFWTLGNTPFDRETVYRRLLDVPLPESEVHGLVNAVSKGWPLGSEMFLAHIARSTERRLAPLPRGRPAKVK